MKWGLEPPTGRPNVACPKPPKWTPWNTYGEYIRHCEETARYMAGYSSILPDQKAKP